MKLPKEIKIGGHIYKVIFPYVFMERSDIYGQANSDQNELRIAGVDCSGAKLADSRIKEFFWHEVIHVIDHIYNGAKLDDDTVRRLGEGLMQVLNDNGFLKEE